VSNKLATGDLGGKKSQQAKQLQLTEKSNRGNDKNATRAFS
jgi:hypothetical protein